MIQGSEASLQAAGWRQILATAITDPAELLSLLDLPDSLLPAAQQASRLFSLRVPRPYLDRIQRGNPHDPLLRQILPLDAECYPSEGFSNDPVGDQDAMLSPGLLQKYPGRALLLTTGACGIHCRYCFRRHFPYTEANPAQQDWQQALEQLTADPTITEIILSGGDPLSLSDKRLGWLAAKLAGIPHIERLRIHTRLPVVVPARVDAALCDWLTALPLQKVMVLHINHAREIDTALEHACQRLLACGVTLLNQSVLLAGVNDTVDSLHQLSERLFACGVLPYYLHQLDRVNGAAHFEVSDVIAQKLVATLRNQLPGYLIPRLVREHAGTASKTPL